MKKQASNVRQTSISTFLSVVKENHRKTAMLDTQLKKLEREYTGAKDDDHYIEFWKKTQTVEDKLISASFIVIVFSAITLEAYIYDYAARYLTDSFVKDHLDKLDTFSKWVVVPALITGRELPPHPNWQGPLRQLIKTRNSIIHHKSAEFPPPSLDTKRYFKKLKSNSAILLQTAEQSPRLLRMLADKIKEVHPEETPWVNSYLT